MNIFKAIVAFPAVLLEEFVNTFKRIEQDEIEIITTNPQDDDDDTL